MGEDGYPARIWDKVTGDIDHDVAEYWRENYDLRHIMERDWKTLGGQPIKDGYEFTTGGRFPLDRVSVVVDGASYLVSARLFSRAESDQAWRARGEHLFYGVSVNGQATAAEPVAIATRDQHWRVELVNPGDHAPKLRVGWLPHELVFLRQGLPPFLLAFGQAGLEGREWPVDEILRSLGEDSALDQIPTASVGGREILGGPDRLLTPPTPVEWQNVLLWVVLLGGVAVVGVLAYRLLR